MSGMIYGVFDTRAQAEAAIEVIEDHVGHDSLNVLIHEGRMRDEDLQMGGTDALKGAVKGALVVGCVAALLGGLFLIPGANMSVGWTEFVFLAGGGTIMGVTAGAVAGASEPRKELVAMARRLEEGKVLVTIATDELPSAAVVELLEVHGAVEAQAA